MSGIEHPVVPLTGELSTGRSRWPLALFPDATRIGELLGTALDP